MTFWKLQCKNPKGTVLSGFPYLLESNTILPCKYGLLVVTSNSNAILTCPLIRTTLIFCHRFVEVSKTMAFVGKWVALSCDNVKGGMRATGKNIDDIFQLISLISIIQ